jgi:large subunit ribosomal protein L4
LTASLRAKAKSQSILAIDSLTGLEPKTKALAQLLKRIQVSEKALLVVDRPDPLLTRISRNLSQVTVRPVRDLNCYDVLNHSQVVVTAEAFKQLEGLVG